MTNARTIGIIGAFAGVTVALCAFAVASTYAVRGLRLVIRAAVGTDINPSDNT